MKIMPDGNETQNSYFIRIFLLLCFIMAFAGVIILRLFNLQVINHGYYQSLALDQHQFETTILPKRGEIYLTSASGNPILVATNITKDLVYAVPKEIKDTVNVAAKLAPLIEVPQKEILAKFAGNQNYVPLKKQLPDETSAKIKALKLPGVYLGSEDLRFYPENRLASQVLGFVGFSGAVRVGQYGIEGGYERQLAGTKGILDSQKDVAGRWITLAARTFIPAQDGDDIYLTLDSAIQFKAEEVLKKTVTRHGADSGSVIVLDPKTGAILALANQPDFNPNEYGKVNDLSAYNDRAIAAEYEPGSVFKPMTMSAAINEDKVTPDTTYQDNGVVKVDDREIKNSDGKGHGIQTMTGVLDESLNTGAVFVEQQLGNDTFKKYVQQFGFGKPLNLGLSGEAKGNLDNLNQKGNVFFATASFGQGITITPIQLVAAYTAFANNGKMMQPYIVSKIQHADGTIASETLPQSLGQVISPKTAATISAMLTSVVENGHGKRAGVRGYYIAGKTGTAQVAFKDKPGYDPNKNIGTFVGFGPVDNPAFLMLVRIDNPKDVKFAESTAAPAFGEIANFILNYLQIPPTRQ